MRAGLAALAQSVREMARWPAARAGGILRAIASRPATTLEGNIWILSIEVIPAAVLSAAASFNAAFAVRLGATNEEIGFLSSIPALLAVLVMIPSGQIFGSRARRMPLVIWSLFLVRMAYLLIAFVPLLGGFPQGTIAVWLLIAAAPISHFFGVGWNSMLADVLPEVKRPRVFAIRNILASIVTTAAIYLAGLWLDWFDFPTNYQVMYLVGFASALLSTYYITKMQVRDSVVPPPRPRRALRLPAVRSTVQDIGAHRDFIRIIVNTFLHGCGLWMIGPLYILYYVRTLGATDGWIGLNGTLASLTPIVGYYVWQRAISRWGENRILKSTIVLIGLYPLAVGLAPGLSAILLLTALQGLIAPGVNLSHFPMLLKVCPDAQRPQYIAIYSTIMNIGAFIMPLLGVYLSAIFGFAPMLVVGGIMSVLGSSSFVWHALRTPDSALAQQSAPISAK